MSTTEKLPTVLNVESLIAPISEEKPCGTSREHGEDIELDVSFGQLRLDFDMARRIERARSELALLKEADRNRAVEAAAGRPDSPEENPPWDKVIKQSEQILLKHSKDLRVVAWMVEAACRVHGFIGLRDALDVSSQLINRYGDQLYPLPTNPDDKLYRLGPLRNLNTSTSLLAAIQSVSFVQSKQAHLVSFEIAKYIKTLPLDEQESHRKLGKLSEEDFSELAVGCSQEEVDLYNRQLDETLAAATELDGLLRSLTSPENYSIRKIIDQLEQVRAWFKTLCRDRPAPEEEQSPAGQAGEGAPQPARSGDVVSSAIRSREEALGQLLKVAKFFRSTEPHSPVSYALEQAVRWGKMPLPELLKELVQDSSVLSDMYRRMGIQESE